MAIVPKRKHSKARRNTRRSKVWKLEAPALSRCSKCGAFKLIHRVCKSGGYYRNREVVKKEA